MIKTGKHHLFLVPFHGEIEDQESVYGSSYQAKEWFLPGTKWYKTGIELISILFKLYKREMHYIMVFEI